MPAQMKEQLEQVVEIVSSHLYLASSLLSNSLSGADQAKASKRGASNHRIPPTNPAAPRESEPA